MGPGDPGWPAQSISFHHSSRGPGPKLRLVWNFHSSNKRQVRQSKDPCGVHPLFRSGPVCAARLPLLDTRERERLI